MVFEKRLDWNYKCTRTHGYTNISIKICQRFKIKQTNYTNSYCNCYCNNRISLFTNPEDHFELSVQHLID